jgi:hypothetical protein
MPPGTATRGGGRAEKLTDLECSDMPMERVRDALLVFLAFCCCIVLCLSLSVLYCAVFFVACLCVLLFYSVLCSVVEFAFLCIELSGDETLMDGCCVMKCMKESASALSRKDKGNTHLRRAACTRAAGGTDSSTGKESFASLAAMVSLNGHAII